MRYPMRGVRNEYAMILFFERLGYGIWSYGTSDWGWLASTVVSMACQSQLGILWLDLADTIWWILAIHVYLWPTVLWMGMVFIIQLAGLSS